MKWIRLKNGLERKKYRKLARRGLNLNNDIDLFKSSIIEGGYSYNNTIRLASEIEAKCRGLIQELASEIEGDEEIIRDFQKIIDHISQPKSKRMMKELNKRQMGKWMYRYYSAVKSFLSFLYYALDMTRRGADFKLSLKSTSGIWIKPIEVRTSELEEFGTFKEGKGEGKSKGEESGRG